MNADNAASPYRSASRPDHGPLGLPAGFGVRAVARVLDVVVGVALALLVGMAVGTGLALVAVAGGMTPGWEAKLGELSFTSVAFSLLGGLLYHALSESIGGASVGKWICGLRVHTPEKSPDGVLLLGLRPCTLRGAVIRHLAVMVDGVLFGLVAHVFMKDSPLQQRLGDQWGETAVLWARSLRSPSSPIVGICAGLTAQSVAIGLGMVWPLL